MKPLLPDAKGPQVKQWQFFLIGQGFDPGTADGSYGNKTVEATKAFQRKHKLDPDGRVGLQTYGQAMLLGLDTMNYGNEVPPLPDFKPLVGTAERQKVFGKFSYVPAPAPGNPEAIRITDNWEKDNIMSVHIPQLAGVKGAPKSGMIRFHRKAANQLQALWEEWEKAGFLPHVLTWAGSYVPRLVRGSTTSLSNHAFGTAFDMNVAWNSLGVQPAIVGAKGSVRELVPIAHKHGFYWGGHFTRKDGMHFEVAVLQ